MRNSTVLFRMRSLRTKLLLFRKVCSKVLYSSVPRNTVLCVVPFGLPLAPSSVTGSEVFSHLLLYETLSSSTSDFWRMMACVPASSRQPPVLLLCIACLCPQVSLLPFPFALQVGNRSSEFHPDVHRVRRKGSYIYEEFLPTGQWSIQYCTAVYCATLLH